jgi:DNA-binding beta-propeller fold protein YncE
MRGRIVWASSLSICAALLLSACARGPSGPPVTASRASTPAMSGCTSVAARPPKQLAVPTALVRLPGQPFGVVSTGRWSFVSSGSWVIVLSDHFFPPRPVRRVRLPGVSAAAGEAVAAGRYLLVAAGSGAVVLDVQSAVHGGRHPVLGTLEVGAGGPYQDSAVEVVASRDGRYAFVSLEYANRIEVFDLALAIAARFHRSGYLGSVLLGQAVVGLAMDPTGRWLYATSELAGIGTPDVPAGQGTLSLISVRGAETGAPDAVVSTAAAGCEPVRVALSPDGRVAWVTARGSDAVLGLSTAALRRHQPRPLLATVRVGAAPVGLAIIDRGRLVLVANSNRAQQGIGSLEVIAAGAALAHRPAEIGSLAAGVFPREVAAIPGEPIALVTDYGSGQLEAVDLARLFRRPR